VRYEKKMGCSRTAFVLAAAALAATACSGSSLVDIIGSDASGTPSPEAGGLDATTGGFDGDDTRGPADSGDKKARDATADDASTRDAQSGDDGSTAPDDAGDLDAGTPADAADAAVNDAGDLDAPAADDAATFACGPNKRCRGETQYCRIAPVGVGPQPQNGPGIVPPIIIADGSILKIDAGAAAPYECLPLPACASANLCKCIDPDKTCTCGQSNGDYTDDCTSTVVDN
jgi:hypothetical protein